MTKTVALYDIDGKIPNLALMKISAYYKKRGFEVMLSRTAQPIRADLHFASTVFRTEKSKGMVADLRGLYGDAIEIGGSGYSLSKRLLPEIDKCFPDYELYNHNQYAIGFVTRGCNKGCRFCLVPKKEGSLRVAGSFPDFVPPDQNKVLLLDDNLLAYQEANEFLAEIIKRKYAVNFSQTLDISFLTDKNFALLKDIDSRNAKFTKRMFYFSCNDVRTIEEFLVRKTLLKGFGEDAVTVIVMYGYNSTLSQDYQIFQMLRSLRLVPFFQEYWPIEGVPARMPANYFDFDLDKVIRLTFRSNGINWEKFLRWLNRLYFKTYGKYYYPLIKIIYRYNNKKGINKYLRNRDCLTEELYKKFI